jgi:hypothetical protein
VGSRLEAQGKRLLFCFPIEPAFDGPHQDAAGQMVGYHGLDRPEQAT